MLRCRWRWSWIGTGMRGADIEFDAMGFGIRGLVRSSVVRRIARSGSRPGAKVQYDPVPAFLFLRLFEIEFSRAFKLLSIIQQQFPTGRIRSFVRLDIHGIGRFTQHPNPSQSRLISISTSPRPHGVVMCNSIAYPLLRELPGTLVLGVAEQFDHAALIRGETGDLLDEVADEGGTLGEMTLGAGDTRALLDLLSLLY